MYKLNGALASLSERYEVVGIGERVVIRVASVPGAGVENQGELTDAEMLLGCPRKVGSMVSKWDLTIYNLLVNGVRWG